MEQLTAANGLIGEVTDKNVEQGLLRLKLVDQLEAIRVAKLATKLAAKIGAILVKQERQEHLCAKQANQLRAISAAKLVEQEQATQFVEFESSLPHHITD